MPDARQKGLFGDLASAGLGVLGLPESTVAGASGFVDDLLSPNNILGGLGVFSGIRAQRAATDEANRRQAVSEELARDQLEEERRQFDVLRGEAGAKLGAQIAAQRASLIENAYQNAAALARAGRGDEATMLKNLADGLQKVLLR